MLQGDKEIIFKETLRLINEFLASKDAVVNYDKALDLKEKLNLELKETDASSEEILTDIKNYFHYSVKTHHPLYANQLNAGANFEAIIAELISIVTNTTMSTYEVSPVATLMEQKLTDELLKKIGFHNGDGIMLTGGSNSNLMAIHVARSERFPIIKKKGNTHHHMQVFVSKEAHYSLKKAMALLGLGIENLILVNTDEFGKMDSNDLAQKIENCITEDKIPLMVCSTAGTTVLGAFDPISKVNEVCKHYGVWHHVDGAWGGAVLFSHEHSELLNGLSEVDSFTFDAHKLLGTGLITSFFLTRHKNALTLSNSGGGCYYLFHEYDNSDFDLGNKSLQCGRKADSLKFWLTWKALGTNGLGQLVDAQFEKRKYFEELVRNHPRLQLVHTPEYLNVCFQVIPPNEKIDINQYNHDLRFRVVQSGKLMINYSSFSDGRIFFRLVFANQATTFKDLDQMVAILIEMAQ